MADMTSSSSSSSPKLTVHKCGMCNVRVQSEEQWKIHLTLWRHKKLVKKNTRDNVHNPKRGSGLPFFLSCDYCHVKCNSEISLREHYRGIKHRKNEAQRMANAAEDAKGIDIGFSEEKTKGDVGKGMVKGYAQENYEVDKGKGSDIGDPQEKAKGDKGKGSDIGDPQGKGKGVKGKGIDIGYPQEKAKGDKGKGTDIGDSKEKGQPKAVQLLSYKLREGIEAKNIMQLKADERNVNHREAPVDVNGSESSAAEGNAGKKEDIYQCHPCKVTIDNQLEWMKHNDGVEHKARVAKP